MKVIPREIFKKTSNAEKHIHKLLQQIKLSDYDVVLHSLNLGEQDKKRWGEADFVILSGNGIFTLEIKGGRVACKNGIWEFTDRNNKTDRKRVGPGEQAKENHVNLFDRHLKKHFNFVENVPNGHGCVFPNISRVTNTSTSSLIEMPDTICAYERHCEIPKQFSSYLKSLSGVYKNKLINQNKRIKELTKDEIDQISSFLRPDFEKVPSLHMQIKETSETIETLTQEQYEKIDGIIDNERCVIIGGAGTGKTFLAMAAALYHAARNEKVLITTRSPYLANYLRSNRNTDNIDIMDIQQIIDKKLDIKFDVIIIDEGQDLCQLDKIQIFENLLKNGFDKGSWKWFGDPNNQVSSFYEFDQEVYDEIIKKSATQYNLKFNVRNTPTIIDRVRLFSGVKMGDPKINKNDQIGFGGRFYEQETESFDQSIDILLNHLQKWFSGDNKMNFNQIAVLTQNDETAKNLKETLLSNGYRSEILNTTTVLSNLDCLLISTVENFKGLEKEIICIFHVDEKLIIDNAKKFFYNSISRANHTVLFIYKKNVMNLIG